MPVCYKCDKEIRGRQKKVSCATCKLEFHTKCQGVSDSKYEVLLENSEDILWFCNSCRVTTANMVHKLSEFELRIKRIESHQESYKKELEAMHGIVKTLNERNKSIEKKMEELREEVQKGNETSANKQIDDLKEQINFLQCKLFNQADRNKIDSTTTKQKLDDMEQESKMNNLRISGMPEEEDEILKIKVLSIANEKLNLPSITEDDIDVCYRLGKEKDSKTRDVLVRFTNREKRNLMYKCRRNMPRESPSIYVNEDLTQLRNKLFYDARLKKKAEKIYATWTQDGNVIIN